MNERKRHSESNLSTTQLDRIDQVCDEFEQAIQDGQNPVIEDFLSQVDDTARSALLHELIMLEIEARRANGEAIDISEYLDRFSSDQDTVNAAFGSGTISVETTTGGTFNASWSEVETPDQIGPFIVERWIGRGGFGDVYEAREPDSDRTVALKVLRPDRANDPVETQHFISEAERTIEFAHAGIVEILGAKNDFERPYIVQEYIKGYDLKAYARQERPDVGRVVDILIGIVEALIYIHSKGLYHRDLKPANILIDEQGRPRLTDFGLAMTVEERYQHSGQLAGSLPYMSREQIRGESHLFNAGSDIWSLGVVMYELLTGQVPFPGDYTSNTRRRLKSIRAEIENREPRGLREVDAGIPAELQRICLKCLSKDPRGRYPSAADLLDDLQQWRSAPLTMRQQASEQRPKPTHLGLRSFDAEHADFFLQLLPGTRDRDQLPSSIRFWKSWIEETNPVTAQRVGVIYGISGSGKSSLIRAGLLPRLSHQIEHVYVSAGAEDTELALNQALAHRFPQLGADNLNLVDSIARLRDRVDLLSDGKKLLIVIDQFEQWLHAHGSEADPELTAALRQCDGSRVQVIVSVRDGFMNSLSRFAKAMDIALAEDENLHIVDLFTRSHAQLVLTYFGRSLGQLSEPLSDDQRGFVERVAGELADNEGRVVCVKLAIFAQMMEQLPWTTASLAEIGGLQGIGLRFLERTFGGPTQFEQRFKETGPNLLTALLPERGVSIKGNRRSASDLQNNAKCHSGEDFRDLVHFLEHEKRLITPVDPPSEPSVATDTVADQDRYYQLTHDYIVPILREFVETRQTETRRGRARLRLAQRTSLWTNHPDKQQLPKWWEWVQLRWLTRPADWNTAEARMMRAAGKFHWTWMAVGLVVTLASVFGLYETVGRMEANAVVRQLDTAKIGDVPSLLSDVIKYDRWTTPKLRSLLASGQSQNELNLRLGLLHSDPEQLEPLLQLLLQGTAGEVQVISEVIRSHDPAAAERLWRVVDSADSAPSQRVRAAAAMAQWKLPNEDWQKRSEVVVESLLLQQPYSVVPWIELLKPVGDRLIPFLLNQYSAEVPETSRQVCAIAVAEYLAQKPTELVQFIVAARTSHLGIACRKLASRPAGVAEQLQRQVDLEIGLDIPLNELSQALARKANAAAALLLMQGDAGPWHLLAADADPDLRTMLIERIAVTGVPLETVLKQAKAATDAKTQIAMLFVLGDYSLPQVPYAVRIEVIDFVSEQYQSSPHSGVHFAAQWLGRTLGFADRLSRLKREPANKSWETTANGHEMVLVRSPQEFYVGSPSSEPFRGSDEHLRKVKIPYAFAISTTEVTVQQYQKYLSAKSNSTDQRPVTTVTHAECMRYCRWLTKEAGMDESDMCYEIVQNRIQVREDFLSRQGFRLPLENEWEFACRAGTTTARYFGTLPDESTNYCWGFFNSPKLSQAVGLKKPNWLGLFDTLGNVEEWCQERYSFEGTGRVNPRSRTGVMRGGSTGSPAANLRAARRRPIQFSASFDFRGFRIARTIKGSKNSE